MGERCGIVQVGEGCLDGPWILAQLGHGELILSLAVTELLRGECLTRAEHKRRHEGVG